MLQPRTSAKDLLTNLRGNSGRINEIISDAKNKRHSITTELSRIQGCENDEKGLDGFERLLKEAGIVVNNDFERGVYSSECKKFVDGSLGETGRFLLMELCFRSYRKSLTAPISTRKALADTSAGSLTRPYYDSPEVEWTQRIEPSIPLSRVVSMMQGIDRPDYRSYHITYSATGLRMYRVAEMADIPEVNLAKSDHVINLHKYGRAIRMSMEWLMNITIAELQQEIQFVAAQSEVDKIAAFITICTSGDGNTGTSATTSNLTTLDSAASAGTLTAKGWSAFKKLFDGAYILNVALMQAAVATQLELLNTGSGNNYLYDPRVPGVPSLTPINSQAQSIGYGWTSDAAALTILGLDNRRSPKYLFWVDADFQDSQRFIQNMTELLVIADYSGFSVRDANAARILDVNA